MRRLRARWTRDFAPLRERPSRSASSCCGSPSASERRKASRSSWGSSSTMGLRQAAISAVALGDGRSASRSKGSAFGRRGRLPSEVVDDRTSCHLEKPGFELFGQLHLHETLMDLGKDVLEDIFCGVLVSNALGNEALQASAELSPDRARRSLIHVCFHRTRFAARTNALLNLPSTCGAIASASIPAWASMSRASSTR